MDGPSPVTTGANRAKLTLEAKEKAEEATSQSMFPLEMDF